jgi:PTH1 family peptidyl-tRNA hydrolase
VRILFGIGNPGKKYTFNRHNAGFLVLDYFAETHSLEFKPSKFDYYFAEGQLSDESYVLVKPMTYVNQSGVAAKQVISFYQADLKDFLVVYDDFNLEFSKLRVRMSGSDGGHNGLSSIIYNLNSDQFPRFRIGIGNDFKPGQMAKYVLDNFTRKEKKVLTETFKLAEVLLEEFITGGIKKMLDANSRISKSESGLKDISNK